MEESKEVESSQSELFVMRLSVMKDGTVGFKIESEDPNQNPGTLELVGLLEMIKSDIINGHENSGQEIVQVTLEEMDFKLPQSEQLKAMGKKVGDVVDMPKSIALARESVLADIANGTFNPDQLLKSLDEKNEKVEESTETEKKA